MKKVLTSVFLLCTILFFAGCSKKSNAVLAEVNRLNWYADLKEANKAIELLEEGISQFPNDWKLYDQELNILAEKKSMTDDEKIAEEILESMENLYESWLSDGNKLDIFSQLNYANILYCLGKESDADEFYKILWEKWLDNSKKRKPNEDTYVAGMFSGIMLDKITKANFEETKDSRFNGSGLNDYFYENLLEYSKIEIADIYSN